MALDKEEQAFLYERCRDALGDRGAKLLMTELPPTGWENLATKQDLAVLKQDLEILEHKLTAGFERALRGQTKLYIAWTSGLTAILVAVFGWITTIAVR